MCGIINILSYRINRFLLKVMSNYKTCCMKPITYAQGCTIVLLGYLANFIRLVQKLIMYPALLTRQPAPLTLHPAQSSFLTNSPQHCLWAVGMIAFHTITNPIHPLVFVMNGPF